MELKDDVHFCLIAKGVLGSDCDDVFQAAGNVAAALIEATRAYAPDFWCIEQQGTAMTSYLVSGMLASSLRQKGVDVKFMNPMRMKKLVTGFGKADKQTVRDAVTDYVGEAEFSCWDESDAVGIGVACLLEVFLDKTGQTEEYERRHHSSRTRRYCMENPAAVKAIRQRHDKARKHQRNQERRERYATDVEYRTKIQDKARANARRKRMVAA